MRHRKGLGPYLSRQTTDGRLFEGNIGSGGSDEGIAGGDDDGNYDSPSDDPGRDSSRFNGGGGGGGGSDPTRRQQRRAIREGVPVSEIVDRETGGRSSFDPGEVTVDDPEFQQRRAIREFDTGGVQTDVDVSTPQAGRGTELGNADGSVAIDDVPVVGDAVNAVQDVGDFVRSGPDEASVGDPEFNDPGTVETEVPAQTGGNETVDPSRPLTGVDQELVNETTDSGGIVAERPGDSSALLPGEIGGFDISEQRLEEFAAEGERINERITPNGTAEVSAGPGNQLVADVGATTGNAVGNIVQGAAETPGVVESGVEFAQNAPISGESVQTAGSVAVGAAANMGQRAFNDPGLFAAELGVGAVTGTAATRVGLGAASRAPVSTRRVDFETDSGTTAVRGVEVGAGSRRTDIFGTTGFRPQAGTPAVDLDAVDLEAQGGKMAFGPEFEPRTGFETRVSRESLDRSGASDDALQRFDTARDLAEFGGRVDSDSLEVDAAEEVVRDVQAVPDTNAEDVAAVLQDTDSVVFGSAAQRAQRIDMSRQPRDLDVAVRDPESFQTRAESALEGESATVDDVFDVKQLGEGFPESGEVTKFGQRASDPVVTDDGVAFAPLSDELTRKSGAAAFVRGPGSATDELDVGPQPARPGKPPRVKDAADAAGAGRNVRRSGFFNDEPAPVGDFEDAFGGEIRRAQRGPDPDTPAPDEIEQPDTGGLFGDFVEETRAEARLIGQRPRRLDSDVGRRVRDSDTRSRRGDNTEGESSTPRQRSPDVRRESPSPTRIRSDSPSVVPGVVGGAAAAFGMSPSSGTRRRSSDSPDSGFVPSDSPSGGVVGSDSPTGGTPADRSPTAPPLFGPSPEFGSVPTDSPTGGTLPGQSPPGVSPPSDSPPGQSPPGRSPGSAPTTTPSPPSSPTPPGVPGRGDSGPRRDIDLEIEESENDPLPLSDLPPETPLFGNPVASGVGDILDQFDN